MLPASFELEKVSSFHIRITASSVSGVETNNRISVTGFPGISLSTRCVYVDRWDLGEDERKANNCVDKFYYVKDTYSMAFDPDCSASFPRDRASVARAVVPGTTLAGERARAKLRTFATMQTPG